MDVAGAALASSPIRLGPPSPGCDAGAAEPLLRRRPRTTPEGGTQRGAPQMQTEPRRGHFCRTIPKPSGVTTTIASGSLRRGRERKRHSPSVLVIEHVPNTLAVPVAGSLLQEGIVCVIN